MSNSILVTNPGDTPMKMLQSNLAFFVFCVISKYGPEVRIFVLINGISS